MAKDEIEDQFDEVAAVAPLVDRWLAETRPPRTTTSLVDLVDLVAPPAGSTGVDLGAYAGAWSAHVAKAYGCEMVALDLAFTPLVEARAGGLQAVNASVDHLPFATGSLSLVWCRDTLSMVADVPAAMVEIARVLRRGAGAVVYTAVTTAKLEPVERAELIQDLQMPDWWTSGRVVVDDAIASAGLDVITIERFSPEYQESALRAADSGLLADLALLGRYERESASLEALATPRWARRFRAWSAWPAYLLLGKLETVAWVLRRV